MDPIIRSAAVSNVAFELRRPGARGASATPAAAPGGATGKPAASTAPATAATAAAAAPAPSVAAAAPAAPAAAPVIASAVTFAATARASAPAPAAPSPASFAAAQEAARLAVQAELTELRADAERRGYAAGYDRGEAEARRHMQSQVERFHGLAARLDEARAALLDDAEDGAVELAFVAVCRILGEQAATREGVLAMVAQCAIAVREREQVDVRLHPDDFAQLGTEGAQQLRFRPDPGIVMGGCVVDGANGSLDARLETQLARLAETLLTVRAARRQAQDAQR